MKLLIQLLSIMLFLCDSEEHCKRCIEKIPQHFNYLKTYKVSGEREKNEYSYVFTAGTTYHISICSDASVSFTLEDSSRNKVIKDVTIDRVAYKCTATGIYYLSYQVDGKNSCAGSVLSFNR